MRAPHDRGSHVQVWYAERAAGIVAYVLLTALVVLGLALSNRVRTRAWPAFAIEDVHRFVGILAGVFVALHVGLIAIDTFVPFSVSQILVPFTADYRPVATGLGTVALELLVAVAIIERAPVSSVARALANASLRGLRRLGRSDGARAAHRQRPS